MAVRRPPTWPPTRPPPPIPRDHGAGLLSYKSARTVTPNHQEPRNIWPSTAAKPTITTANQAAATEPLAPTTRPISFSCTQVPMPTTVMPSAMMSSTVTSAAAVRAGRFPARLPAAGLAPRRRSLLLLRAQTEPEMNETEPKKAKAASPSIWDALAFSGPAPERINGRLAMVGFVTALAVEASTRGDGLLSQATSGTGLAWFAYTAAALSAASLVPLLQGETAEARSDGFMTANAELWNGRLAMLGLVALAVTEYLTGAPFINA